MVKFFLLMVVISVVIRIGLSLVLPPHWAAVGQLMGTLAFGLCILLSPLRPRYFQYPSVRDQEKVPQDNEQPHGELYFVDSDNRSLYPGWSPVLPVRPRLTRPIAEINSPRRVQVARPRVLCALRNVCRPPGAEQCRSKPEGRWSAFACWRWQSRTVSTATARKDRWLIHLIPAIGGAPAA